MSINSLNKKNILALTLITVIAFFLFVYFFVFAQGPSLQPGSEFKICTVNINPQPACYDEDSIRPTLNWTFNGFSISSQVSYWIQIDDNGNHSGVYPSPEVNTGEILSSNKFHLVNPGQLEFNTTYYWKITIKDDWGSWSGWTCADVTFTTSPPCNKSPTAANLSVAKGDYCATPAHYFSWTYSDPDGDDESQFQFQVDNNSDFSSPEIDWVRSGLSNPSPSPNDQTVIVSTSPGSDQIGYNTTYYWQVKVWDAPGNDSGWIQGPSFTTEKHRYPSINFNWSPTEPSQEENVLFSDQSTVYGGSAKSAWAWTFTNGNPASSSQQNPTIQFTSEGSKQVTLKVTDSDTYFCQISKSVGVQAKLPGWIEVLPQ